jgi:L-rhamnose isomerase/sugar isomerase
LVDRKKLAEYQAATDIVGAEETLRSAFYTDVQPILKAWRESKGLPLDPLKALRNSNEIARRAEERPKGRAERGEVAGGGYA